MAPRDVIEMSMKELKRLKVLQAAIEKRIRQREAAEKLGISRRQARRIIKAIREEGDRGVVHRARGKASNSRMPQRGSARL